MLRKRRVGGGGGGCVGGLRKTKSESIQGGGEDEEVERIVNGDKFESRLGNKKREREAGRKYPPKSFVEGIQDFES